MQLEQSLMIAGATIAGVCFAMAVTYPEKRFMYYGLGFGGLLLVSFAYLQITG